jgi:phosphatidylserine/phosphatidylglycerophosphate/cardiolipin synthase-like enzyme
MIKISLLDRGVFAKLSADIKAANRRALAKTGDELFDLLYAAADKHTKTGGMIRSLNSTLKGNTYTIEHSLQKAPHAAFVHWGTRPHVIKPRNKKALRFPVGGAFAFARQVNHPGYKGDPYFVTIATPERVHSLFAAFLTAELPK